jgi:hypothetical protein
MLELSERIPNSYNNPLALHLKAILQSGVLKYYSLARTSLNDPQEGTVKLTN